MPSLPELNALFEDLARDLFPGIAVKPDFKPLYNLSYGDVGTEMCQSIADRTRQAPDEIAAKFISRLPAGFPAGAEILEGHINLRYPPLLEWLEGQEPACSGLDGRACDLLLPGAAHFPSVFAFARFVCAAWVQAWMLGSCGAVSRLITGGMEWTFPSWAPLLRLTGILRCALEQGAGERAAPDYERAAAELSGRVSPGPDRAVFLRAWPDLAWNPHFRELNQSLRRNSASVVLKSVEKVWYEDCPDDFSIQALAAFDDETLTAAALYLAGNQLAADIDPEIPVRKGHASLFHYLQLSSERLRRLSLPDVLLPSGGSGEVILPAQRELLIQIRFLNCLMGCSARDALAGDFLMALGQLLDRSNRMLNDGAFRNRCSAGALSAIETKITAGVGEVFSDMLKLIVP